MPKKRTFLLLCLIVTFGLHFQVQAKGLYAVPGEIVMSSCTSCHRLKPVCTMLKKKDRAAWEKTVNAMVAKGAKVQSDDIPILADYLSGPDAKAELKCP